jgi:hypothetical protein
MLVRPVILPQTAPGSGTGIRFQPSTVLRLALDGLGHSGSGLVASNTIIASFALQPSPVDKLCISMDKMRLEIMRLQVTLIKQTDKESPNSSLPLPLVLLHVIVLSLYPFLS